MYLGYTGIEGSDYFTYNIKKLLPNYATLSADNFFLSGVGWVAQGASHTSSITKTYNADTGLLSIRRGNSLGSGTYRGGLFGYVYYISEPLPFE